MILQFPLHIIYLILYAVSIGIILTYSIKYVYKISYYFPIFSILLLTSTIIPLRYLVVNYEIFLLKSLFISFSLISLSLLLDLNVYKRFRRYIYIFTVCLVFPVISDRFIQITNISGVIFTVLIVFYIIKNTYKSNNMNYTLIGLLMIIIFQVYQILMFSFSPHTIMDAYLYEFPYIFLSFSVICYNLYISMNISLLKNIKQPAFCIEKDSIISNRDLKILFKNHNDLYNILLNNLDSIKNNDTFEIESDHKEYIIFKDITDKNDLYYINPKQTDNLINLDYEHINSESYYNENYLSERIIKKFSEIFLTNYISLWKTINNNEIELISEIGNCSYLKNRNRLSITSIKELNLAYEDKTIKIVKDNVSDKYTTLNKMVIVPLFHKKRFYGFIFTLLDAGAIAKIKDKIYMNASIASKALVNISKYRYMEMIDYLSKYYYEYFIVFDKDYNIVYSSYDDFKSFKDIPCEKRAIESRMNELTNKKFSCFDSIDKEGVHHSLIIASHKLDNKTYYILLSHRNTTEDRSFPDISQNKEYLDKFFNTSLFGVFIETNNKIIYVNSKFEDFFSLYTPNSQISFIDLLPKELKNVFKKNINDLLINEGTFYDKIYLKNKDKNIVINLFLNSFENEEGSNIIGILMDMTQLSHYEDEVINLKKANTLQNLSYILGNQMNNLLQPIVGYTTYLKTKISPDIEIFKTVEKIEKSTKIATDFIKGISLKHYKSNKTLDLYAETKNIIDIMNMLKPDNVEINLYGQEDLYCSNIYLSDFNQIVINIIQNSIESIKTKGIIEIKFSSINNIKKETIQIYKLKDREFIHIQINDNGKGINDEIKPLLFKPHFTTKDSEHYGLGLTIVLELIDKYNGFVEIDDNIPKGISIHLYLPALRCFSEFIENKKESFSHIKELLIAEDEAVVASFLGNILDDLKIKYHITSSSIEFFNYFKENKSNISHVYIDVHLPVISGLELYAMIKSEKDNIFILFSSGYFNMSKVEHILKRDKNTAFLKKPFDFKKIINTLLKSKIKQ